MSSSIALRRSPKPGRLDRRHFEAAAQFVDDQGGQRLAFDVLSDDQQRLAGLDHRFEQRQQRLQARQLLFVEQDVGVVEFGDHLLGIGHEIRADIAAVELHALDDVELGLERFASSTVMTPSLPTFCIASAIIRPISWSLLAETVPTCWISSLVETFLCAFRFCDHCFDRPVDAALQIHRVHAGRDRLGALTDDRLGENGRGGRAVARQVAGLRGHLAHHLRAHILELVGELDLLRDGDAVLADRGAPKDLSRTTLRPFGPKVTLTALARMSMPRSIRSRASV